MAWSFLLTTALLCAPTPPLNDTPEELLRNAKRFLRQKKTDPAVALLRRLTHQFPEAEASRIAGRLLVDRGYGSNTHVVLKDERQLRRFGISAARVVESIESKLAELRVFYEQTFPQPTPLELDIKVIVFDSRSRFRSKYPKVKGRSALTIRPAGKEGEQRGTIAVYFDSRVAQREDTVDLLERGVIRELAVLLLRASSKARFPASLETGLCEYLSLRLFPRKLSAIARTQEAILKGYAREGLKRVEQRAAFHDHLTSPDPVGSRTPAAVARWRGLCYALFDYLISGELAKQPQEGQNGRTERIRKFQSFLRDYDDLADEKKVPLKAKPRLALLNRVLLRHLGVRLDAVHIGLLRHARKYPPSPPDYEGITD